MYEQRRRIEERVERLHTLIRPRPRLRRCRPEARYILLLCHPGAVITS
ncbi:hypothetical protein [Streptomyces sp. NPDC051636]